MPRRLSVLPYPTGAMHAVCARRELRDDLASSTAGASPGPLIAGHIAGGTHHAFWNRGEGFCVFSDIAVSRTQERRQTAGVGRMVAWLRVFWYGSRV